MRALLTFTVLTGLLAGPALAADVKIADIAVIPIHDGINVVPHFAADGRAATIVKAWRDNGNAHGHDVYLATLPPKTAEEGYDNGVVALDDGEHPLQDTITDAPFDGERVLGAVRFARAKVDGAPAVVLIDAELGQAKSGVTADHAPAAVSVYVLRHPGVDVGTTPDVFKRAFKVRAVGLYCNADMVLNQTLGLPLPDGYAGGKAPSGCAS